MVLNTQVEEIVEEIKLGKRDLFDTIKEYMLIAESIDEQVNKVSDELETRYGHEIENLDNEISDLEDTIEEQDDKIKKLEQEIEYKNREIENLQNKIFDLETIIEDYRIGIR